MSILTLVSLCLFISLGVWQLKRAEEKKNILHQVATTRNNQYPIDWAPNQPLPLAYHPIQVKGHYTQSILLLDNQHENHQFGYHVLSPFVLDNQHTVIIDRGWIPRELVSHIETPAGKLTLSGNVYYPSSKQWLLGQAIEIKSPHLAQIEVLDTQVIKQFLHKSVYPFIIRLNEHDDYGYIRHWVVVNMPPERHFAYAFQWFTIAGVILLIYIVLNLNYEKTT